MQKETANTQRRVLHDFPELQVGFPERNDASGSAYEMERIHVDMETLNISKKRAADIARELRNGRSRA